MRRRLFKKIVLELLEFDEFFVQRYDAIGNLGFLPEQKATAALRMLAYGSSADQLDELIRMGESTALECLERFCTDIVEIFGAEYLRTPTADDLKKILSDNEKRGWPGMVGSLDCMHWAWKNCPIAWQGAFKGKEKCPTIILEASCTQDLRIWHFFFGMPGSNNDLNVLDRCRKLSKQFNILSERVLFRSPLFQKTINGTAPSISYTINGNEYENGYYLADGIYPDWSVFMKTISQPRGRKEQHYAMMQEATRKDIERCFGVLQARFRIITQPCKLWSASAMHTVIMACCILHNMIIIDESDEILDNEHLFDGTVCNPANGPFMSSARRVYETMSSIERSDTHYKCRNDLVEHLWNVYGDAEGNN
jgi:hypothetical protein